MEPTDNSYDYEHDTRETIHTKLTILRLQKENLEKRVDSVETNVESYIRTERDNFKELLKMIGEIKKEISNIKWLATGVGVTLATIAIYREEISGFLKLICSN